MEPKMKKKSPIHCILGVQMNEDLKKIIEQSSFEIMDGTYIYAKVSTFPDQEKHFLVSKDQDEITVITKEENLADLELIERNNESYKLIALNVSIPFYAVGFLASVSLAIAEAGMNILIISTYSKDYILIKKEKIEEAKSILKNLGFKEI